MKLVSILIVGAAALVGVTSTATPGQARDNTGAAVAAGVAGGIAAGAIAAGAGRRPTTYYPGGNSYQAYDAEPECRVVTRRSVDDYGRTRTSREEVCD